MRVPERSLRPRGDGAGAAALFVILLGLAGCGGGGDGSGGAGSSTAAATTSAPAATESAPSGSAGGASDRRLIGDSIDAVFVSADPAKACEDFVTSGYVAKTFGDLEGCGAAQVPEAAARSVDVSAVTVTGDRATADAVPHGGPSDGELVHVALIRAGAAWKVDSLESDVPVGP
jgi:hypothetical protein